MRMIAVAVALLMLPNDWAAGGTGLAWAEDAALEPNARVRVTELAGRRLVGRLVDANEGSLTVAVPNKTVVVPRQALAKLEVSRRPSRKGRGAMIGLLVGAASGAIVGYTSESEGYTQPFCSFLPPCESGGEHFDHRPSGAIAYGALFGALGAGIGAAAAPGERWETVGAGRLRAQVSPARGGAGLTLALSF